MKRVVVTVASDVKAKETIAKAQDVLGQQLEVLQASCFVQVQTSNSVDGPTLKGALLAETSMERKELREWLDGVEDKFGLVRNADVPRALYTDIVLWDGEMLDEGAFTNGDLQDSLSQLLSGDYINPNL